MVRISISLLHFPKMVGFQLQSLFFKQKFSDKNLDSPKLKGMSDERQSRPTFFERG